eukprot:gene8891-9810_t
MSESTEIASNKKKEIFTYDAPWTVYTMAWKRHPAGRFHLAIGSFMEEYINQVVLLRLDRHANDGDGDFVQLAKMDHPYPPTQIMFAPAAHKPSRPDQDLLASSGDYLRLWEVGDDNKMQLKALLNNSKHSDYCAPVTGFDWNETDPNIIGSCSIDTTCTIWDVQSQMPKTQLIAHDKEVYDIAFAPGKDIFGTVGADGSVRMFDLRALEHSTILFETLDLSPLLRLAWNKLDANYIATIHTESNKAIILDVRMPSVPVAELVSHYGAVNDIAWAPHSANHICTCGEDRQALIWDTTTKNVVCEDPILAFSAGGEINQMLWCQSHQEYITICFNNTVQVLKV